MPVRNMVFPFRFLCVPVFRVRGANIPAILRAIVACGWFGIQTWIGGAAIYQMIRVWSPSLPEIGASALFPQAIPFICFLAFWALNMFIVYLGVESIRKLLVFKAIFLPLAALALLFWAINASNGLGPILQQPSKFTTTAQFADFFLSGPNGHGRVLGNTFP